MIYKKISILFILCTTICFANTKSDTTSIKNHLIYITKNNQYRNYQNIVALNQTASYIQSVFKQYTNNIQLQKYYVNGQEYKNIIASFGTENTKRIIIGAHYDVCGNQEGADDNASGVVGLLELAKMLQNKKLNYRIDLVAYTLEEPPFFRSEYMGSYIHAKSLFESKATIYGMISLEMIGFFKDSKHSQQYPIKPLSLFYGNKGNFITIVKKFNSGKFVKRFSKKFIKTNFIKTKKFTGPKQLPGIDFSDHLNYWMFNYSALMLTDTSFYRSPHYLQTSDQLETLDINRMAKVIDAVFETIINL